MGVLYHLKHPLLALERVCSVTREMAAVESFVLREQEERNLLQFFEYDEFGGQVDNWCAPTTACLMALCRTAGFARAELSNRHEYGAAVTCYRRWGAESRAGAPRLLAAVNADDFGINFRSDEDQYVTVAAEAAELSREGVYPEVGGYGVKPVTVTQLEGGSCLVHFKLPPGLTGGWHEVRLGSDGNAVEIAVDVDAATERVAIRGACDGVSWTPGSVSLANGFLSLWVEGLPRNADVANIRVDVRKQKQVVMFVGAPDEAGLRQVNARVKGCSTGAHEVSLSIGEARSEPLAVEFVE
jgi:hypothetical protein